MRGLVSPPLYLPGGNDPASVRSLDFRFQLHDGLCLGSTRGVGAEVNAIQPNP